MTPTTAIEEAVAEANARVATALKTIQNYYGLTNADTAGLIGKETNWVQDRTGKNPRPCKTEDLFRFAVGLQVPTEILIQPRDEVLRWLIENPPPSNTDPVVAWNTDQTSELAAA